MHSQRSELRGGLRARPRYPGGRGSAPKSAPPGGWCTGKPIKPLAACPHILKRQCPNIVTT